MERFVKIKRAVITGPTGIVGQSLIRELVSNNIAVTAVCRPGSTRNETLPDFELLRTVCCDLEDYEKLPELLCGVDFDAFFHLAWNGVAGDSRNNAVLQTLNIQHSVTAAKVAAAIGCKVFIGAGSQAEYGNTQGAIGPHTPCFPQTCYGTAKLAAKDMTRAICAQNNLRHVWYRIFSLYGPWDGEGSMVMGSIIKMLRGEYVRFTKGEQIWDYLYGTDAAKALRLAAEKGKDGAVYCVGSGTPRKLYEYITAIRDAIDPGIKIGLGELPYYQNQAFNLQPDISALKEDTGFVPSVSFEDGIRNTINWVKSKGDLG